MSFELQVVQEIEQGKLSTHVAYRKYAIQHDQQLHKGYENSVTLILKTKPNAQSKSNKIETLSNKKQHQKCF